VNPDDPFVHVPPAVAADRLEGALKALGVPVDEGADVDLPDIGRVGAAAGILMSTLIELVVQAAIDDEGNSDSVSAHQAMILGLDTAAGGLRGRQLRTYTQVLQAWALGENMGRALGTDQALSVAGHCEAILRHIGGETEPDTGDGPAFAVGDEGAEPEADLAAEFTVPEADPARRLTRSCMALGILPAVGTHPDADPRASHPGYRVALLAGILTGRSTLEMINAGSDIHIADTGPLPFVWGRGFEYSLITSEDGTADEYTVSGVMMRLVNMIGAWHWQNSDNPDRPHSAAVAHLCAAAILATRADGLAASSVDVQAEFIALHGADAPGAHREAVDKAEAALAALRNLG
jgi:hypothetical protein